MTDRVEMNVFNDIGQILIAIDLTSLEITDKQIAHSLLLFVECLSVGTKQIRELLAYKMACRIF